jgi:hypothetical protein
VLAIDYHVIEASMGQDLDHGRVGQLRERSEEDLTFFEKTVPMCHGSLSFPVIPLAEANASDLSLLPDLRLSPVNSRPSRGKTRAKLGHGWAVLAPAAGLLRACATARPSSSDRSELL